MRPRVACAVSGALLGLGLLTPKRGFPTAGSMARERVVKAVRSGTWAVKYGAMRAVTK